MVTDLNKLQVSEGIMNKELSNLLQSQLQFDSIICLNNTDIDECIEETDNCDDNAVCTNTDGSFTCLCDPGFGGDGVQCEGRIFFYNRSAHKRVLPFTNRCSWLQMVKLRNE